MKRTTDSQIKSSLRMLWLKSPERSQALKNSCYCCEACGVKQSTAKGREQKIEVHHKKGILNWKTIIELIKQQLLCDPELLQSLCPECHKKQDGHN